eukprot:12065261-Alexandrium_andersonii.AAC.1
MQGKAGRRRGGSPGAAPSDRAVGGLHGLGEAEAVEQLRAGEGVDGGRASANADLSTVGYWAPSWASTMTAH